MDNKEPEKAKMDLEELDTVAGGEGKGGFFHTCTFKKTHSFGNYVCEECSCGAKRYYQSASGITQKLDFDGYTRAFNRYIQDAVDDFHLQQKERQKEEDEYYAESYFDRGL